MNSKLKIVSVGPNFCFAETLEKRPEVVFVSHKNRRSVEYAGTPRARFGQGKCLPYFLNVGDIIVAEIGDGNAKRKQATAWAPETVWDGVRGSAGKVAGQVFDLISGINLKKLDPEKDGNVTVRVMDQNRKQLERGYGILSKMLVPSHEDIATFSQVGNIVEALISKRWVQIKNPFFKVTVAKIAA